MLGSNLSSYLQKRKKSHKILTYVVHTSNKETWLLNEMDKHVSDRGWELERNEAEKEDGKYFFED